MGIRHTTGWNLYHVFVLKVPRGCEHETAFLEYPRELFRLYERLDLETGADQSTLWSSQHMRFTDSAETPHHSSAKPGVVSPTAYL